MLESTRRWGALMSSRDAAAEVDTSRERLASDGPPIAEPTSAKNPRDHTRLATKAGMEPMRCRVRPWGLEARRPATPVLLLVLALIVGWHLPAHADPRPGPPVFAP